MRKNIICILALISAVSVYSCGEDKSSQSNSPKSTTTSTTTAATTTATTTTAATTTTTTTTTKEVSYFSQKYCEDKAIAYVKDFYKQFSPIDIYEVSLSTEYEDSYSFIVYGYYNRVGTEWFFCPVIVDKATGMCNGSKV